MPEIINLDDTEDTKNEAEILSCWEDLKDVPELYHCLMWKIKILCDCFILESNKEGSLNRRPRLVTASKKAVVRFKQEVLQIYNDIEKIEKNNKRKQRKEAKHQ